MRLLVLGGTSFVGRHLVEAALGAGHEVTLFNRGRTGPELFPSAEQRRGDRDTGDYASLAGGAWDATVDVTAFVPRHVTQLADAVGARAGRYLLVSTGSVYADVGPDAEGTEDGELLEPETATEEVTDETYGHLKVACEQAARQAHGDGCTIVRPGIVAGPYDPTDRFTWWVRRVARGGELLVPERLDQPVQVVDARDLAAFVVHLVERGTGGAFNAVGPDDTTTLESMIAAIATAAAAAASPELVAVGPDDTTTLESMIAAIATATAAAAAASPELVAVPHRFLREQGAPALPLVLPPAWAGVFRRRTDRADAAGMTHRPLTDTAAATLAWDRARGEPPMAVGWDATEESDLLAAWRASGD